MRRRRLLLLSGVLVVMVLWAWLMLRPKQQPLGWPTRANFEQVVVGMMEEEVEAILGPPGVYATRPLVRAVASIDRDCGVRGKWPPHQEWAENDYLITIEYSDSDRPRVAAKRYVEWPPESIRERFYRLLPWCEWAFGSS